MESASIKVRIPQHVLDKVSLSGLTIQQADAVLISLAVDALIQNGTYPPAWQNEILYHRSYVTWPNNMVYLCVYHSLEN